MVKEITIKLNDDLFSKIEHHKMKQDELITRSMEKFLSKTDKEDKSVTKLKKNLERIEIEKKELENKNKSLEIDNVCLQQQNRNLQGRIDDLVDLYPSAMALLGRPPVTTKIQKNKWNTREEIID
ncbi:MAG: hypothetical protein JXA91_02635 [Candidatus Thermoplasmatota archaeon]|nr:hypothetical protein [Candidatus Thermoplasmatota archaeon]